MPGLVAFRRRWSLGSDDLVVPSSLLLIAHLVWLIILSTGLGLVEFDRRLSCSVTLETYILGYITIMVACIVSEGIIAWISMRGTITNSEPRSALPFFLYIRLGVLLIELGWIIFGLVWLVRNYTTCEDTMAKDAVLGATICNWVFMLGTIISIFCTFDTTGKMTYKLNSHLANRRKARLIDGSDDTRRQVQLEYQNKWNRRIQWWCCVGVNDKRTKTSLDTIARLVTRYFENIDVVLTDVIAGLVLLRQQQQASMDWIAAEGTNDIYQFLSGAAIYQNTRFLRLKHPLVLESYKKVIHFMKYSRGAYGWPMYMFSHTCTGCCRLLPKVRCCAFVRDKDFLIEDNCCQCHFAALRKLTQKKREDIIYVSFHDDIGETPFYVAVDHHYKKIVVCVRGTLSMNDVLTDLCCEAETIPLDSHKPDWLAHKGMVHSAVFIRNMLREKHILQNAFDRCPEKGTSTYGLVITGHSLGAGTASVLAILLQQEYPTLHCYAYSPPGGLLSEQAMQETKTYITSVIVGKDAISRIGLSQMERFRDDIVSIIKKSKYPKWKVIMGGISSCCRTHIDPETLTGERNPALLDSSHQPSACDLYPPGRIIHIVRNHPKEETSCCSRQRPVYQAIWADNKSFNEVLISSRMLTDHMPDNVFDALEKVLVNVGPAKPVRRLPESERRALLSENSDIIVDHHEANNSSHVFHLETSFTNTNPGLDNVFEESQRSSLSWEYTSPLETAIVTPVIETLPALKSPHTLGDTDLKDSEEVHIDSAATENISAPKASPESLSDTSSDESTGAHKYHSTYLTLEQQPDTIAESPLKAVRLKSVDFPDTPPPSPMNNTPCNLDDSQLAQEIFAHFDSNPYCQSTPQTKPNLLRVAATIEFDHNANGDINDSADIDTNDDMDTFDLDRGSKLMYDKLKKSDSHEVLKLAYECETSPKKKLAFTKWNAAAPYECHLPQNNTSQQHYDTVSGHYSIGGRGYPHGMHHTEADQNGDQIRGYYCESESDVAQLDQSHSMHRSKEISDIIHMQDASSVFTNGGVKSSPVLSRIQHSDTAL